MKNAHIKHLIGVLMLLLGITHLVQANAESTNCTVITSLPVTISAPGYYCLAAQQTVDLSSSSAIHINTSNVTLDLNSYAIVNKATSSLSPTFGITAVNRKNITIKNGIVSGFNYGIYLSSTTDRSVPQVSAHLVSHYNLVENMTVTNARNAGMYIYTAGTVIRNCNIYNVASTSGSSVYGILARGSGIKILGNKISNLRSRNLGTAYGITLTSSQGPVIKGNSVSDVRSELHHASGVHLTGQSHQALILNNRFNDIDTLNNEAYAILIDSTSSGKYSGNQYYGVGKTSRPGGYSGGTAVGYN